MRDNTVIFMLPRSTRPTWDGSSAARPVTPGFRRELRRCAVPSALVSACRAAGDAFPTRHQLSRHPCRSLGGNDHLSAIFTPG
ncbi:hypothetical protein H5A22_05640 [Pectobacterium brasiliense]|nr:hypothetical protein [Pectobacterium brasiliense]